MVKFYATWWDYPLDGLLWDCNFISFCNIFPRGAFFFYFNLQSVSLFLIPEFLHPLWRDHPMIIPHGVPFLSLSVLYLPEEKGFWFQFTGDFFLTSEIFYFPWRNHFVIPYAISLEFFFSVEKVFLFQFFSGDRPFITSEILYPPWRDHLVIPYGVPF